MNPYLFRTVASLAHHTYLNQALQTLGSRYVLQSNGMLPWVFKKRKEQTFLILTYHRVVPGEEDFSIDSVCVSYFEQQMRYLAKHYHVMYLEEIVERIQKGIPLPDHCVAITLDDGYQDNYTYIFPILKKYRLPATIFLATGFIDTGEIPWFDRVLYAFKWTKQTRLVFHEQNFEIATIHERKKAAHQALGYLKTYPVEQRDRSISEILSDLRIRLPTEMPDLMLNWDQVKEMSELGIRFGSHTVSHPILSRIPLEQAKEEITRSKQQIEDRIQTEVKTFAYPNGKPGDYTPEIMALVKETGYRAAVTTVFKPNSYSDDLYQLKRFRPWETDLSSFCFRLNLTALLDQGENDKLENAVT